MTVSTINNRSYSVLYSTLNTQIQYINSILEVLEHPDSSRFLLTLVFSSIRSCSLFLRSFCFSLGLVVFSLFIFLLLDEPQNNQVENAMEGISNLPGCPLLCLTHQPRIQQNSFSPSCFLLHVSQLVPHTELCTKILCDEPKIQVLIHQSMTASSNLQ